MEKAPTISFRLDGRVALVTGGASGIGAGIARILAEAGAKVMIADRNREGADAVAAELVADGLEAASTSLELADEASVVAACADTVARLGTPWALVNNAGIHHRELLLDGSAAHWDRINAVNSRGAFLMMREVAKAMVAAGAGGRIVNLASTALTGQIVKGHAAYAASKAAMVGMSWAGALELAEHGITVNTLLPGGVATPGAIGAEGPAPDGPGRRRPPLGMCEPKDIGAAVLFLASPAARMVTNQLVAVDGGFSIS